MEQALGHHQLSQGFAVGDGYSLELLESPELATRLYSLFGQGGTVDPATPICRIRTDKLLKGGLDVEFGTFAPGCQIACGPAIAPSKLVNWVNILLPVADVASMHASAFRWKGEGVGITGNANSGKTGVLLCAISRGACAIGDECLWIDRNAKVRGLFVEMEIRADYFREMPFLRTEVALPTLARVYLFDVIGRTIAPVLPGLSRKFKGRARAHMFPDIIKRHLCGTATMDRLYVSEIKKESTVNVTRVSLDEVIPRLLDIQMTEFSRPFALYREYRKSYPDRKNDWMESIERRLESIFRVALRHTRCFILERPQSTDANSLFGAIADNWE